jgi:diguanylate cyclase (GGDEF)-like protein
VTYPVAANDGQTAGVAVLRKSLASFERDLRQFDRPYFFVSPEGVVLMSNQPDAIYRPFWPLSDAQKPDLIRRFGTLDDRPLMTQGVADATWINIGSERDFVRRRFVGHGDWSLVILKPIREIFATRFLGIIITLLVAVMALIYISGKVRRVHDEVQRDNRLQLQEKAEELGVRATTDALTGLSNRYKFEVVLLDEIRRASRYNSPLTMIIFDIDHFKKVNDTYGHPVGDLVLEKLSRFVLGRVRSSDLFARWGGEEFIVLMPGVDGLDGFKAAEKLCEDIRSLAIDQVGGITCSFGVTQYVPGETAAEFMARLDAALYRAKTGGRNQVKLAPAPGAPGQISLA